MWIFMFIVIFCEGCVYSETLRTIQFHDYCGSSITKDAGSLQFNFSELPRNLRDNKCTVTIQPASSDSQITFYFEQIELTEICKDSNLTITHGDIFYGESAVPGLPKYLCGVHNEVVKNDQHFISGKGHMTITYIHSDFRTQFSRTFKIIFFNFHTGSCSDDEYRCSNGHCINKAYQCLDDIRACVVDKEDCEPQSEFMFWMINILKFAAGICLIATVLHLLARFYLKFKSHIDRMLPWSSTSRERRSSVVDDGTGVSLSFIRDNGETQVSENSCDIDGVERIQITTNQNSIQLSLEPEQSYIDTDHQASTLNSALSTQDESDTASDVSIPLVLSNLSATCEPPPSYEDTLVPSYNEVMDNEHKYQLFKTLDT